MTVQNDVQMLIYDGDCGFCTTCANWITRRWPRQDSPVAIAWQHLLSETVASAGLSQTDLARAAWWIDGNALDEGARAIARALIAAGGLWEILGRVLLFPPISWISALGYRIIARYRHFLPGGTPACKL